MTPSPISVRTYTKHFHRQQQYSFMTVDDRLEEMDFDAPENVDDDFQTIKYTLDFDTDDSDSSFFGDSDDGDIEDDTKDVTLTEKWEPHFDFSVFDKGIAKQPLYSGSSKTVLQCIGERMATFSMSNMSKETMSKFLQLEKETLPQPNSMPSSYKEARKLIKEFLIPVRIYDVCPKHCMVYRDSSTERMFAKLKECPICNKPRNTTRGRARRQVKYLPVGPRFARIFGNESLASVLQKEPNELVDIQDSPKYRSLFTPSGFFEGDKNGIVVGLEADGVAPFHSYNMTYSFTVVTMPVFSMLRKCRMHFRNIFLVMVIPGDSKSEASSQDTYIEILVDELLFLTKVTFIKHYTGAPIKVKIKLLLYILDYPGFGKLFHLSGSGAIKGCIWCEMSGVYCKHLSKTVYLRNRSYLSAEHHLRQQSLSTQFPMQDEPVSAPSLRTQAQSDAYAEAYGKAKNKTQSSTIASATGIKGTYPLMQLPGHDRPSESNPDGMHTLQRCLVNIHNLITGKDDTKNLRLPEETSESHVMENAPVVTDDSSIQTGKRRKKSRCKRDASTSSESTRIPFVPQHPPFVIKDLDLCNKRFQSTVFPLGSGIKIAPIFTTTSSLNSHDWKELACRGILKYCLRNQLAEAQQKTLFKFLDSVAKLFKEHIKFVNLMISMKN